MCLDDTETEQQTYSQSVDHGLETKIDFTSTDDLSNILPP